MATAASKYQAGLRTDPTPGRCGKQGANELGVDNRDVYYDAYGYGFFYEKQEAFDAYDSRLSAILNYKGATSGKVWKEWSDAILSFNLQVCIRNISPSSLVPLIVNSSMLTKKKTAERAHDTRPERLQKRGRTQLALRARGAPAPGARRRQPDLGVHGRRGRRYLERLHVHLRRDGLRRRGPDLHPPVRGVPGQLGGQRAGVRGAGQRQAGVRRRMGRQHDQCQPGRGLPPRGRRYELRRAPRAVLAVPPRCGLRLPV